MEGAEGRRCKMYESVVAVFGESYRGSFVSARSECVMTSQERVRERKTYKHEGKRD